MAFLNQNPNRPSCVVSALPKRFRESLARHLAGSVALTTCSVDDLEMTVRAQGATMAIVGASSNSTEAAERLSHESRSVKVFLAHYQEARSLSAPLNGFAGVFDLRKESDRLAATIKQAASASVRPASFSKSRRVHLLSHFIDMQKRLGNRTALWETLLDGFLSITDADEGMLLLPDEVEKERFQIVAAQGDHLPTRNDLVLLDQACHRTLLEGHLVAHPKEMRFPSVRAFRSPLNFALATPILVAGQLVGCLMGNRTCESEALEEFINGASFIFQQLARREKMARWDQQVTEARHSVSPGWMVVDAQNHIVYREASESLPLDTSSAEIKAPRVRNAVARAHSGKSGSILIRQKMISYRPLEFEGQRCCLLTSNSPSDKRELPPIAPPSLATLLAAFELQPSLSSEDGAFVEDLCKDALETPAEMTSWKLLAPLGIILIGDAEEIPSCLSRGTFILALASKIVSGQPLSARFHQQNDEWFLTVEIKEYSLTDTRTAWTQNSLIKMALQLLPISQLQTGTFGFQARGFLEQTH